MQSRFVWLLSLFFAVAAAQSYSYGVDIDTLTRRQDNGRIVIKPLPQTRNGTVPLRPEIREMQADRYKWDLYILSMSMLMDVNQDDPASWYQIAGMFLTLSQLEGRQYGHTDTCLFQEFMASLSKRGTALRLLQELISLVTVLTILFCFRCGTGHT